MYRVFNFTLYTLTKPCTPKHNKPPNQNKQLGTITMTALTTKRTYDQALALAFAHATELQTWSYYYLEQGKHDLQKQLTNYYMDFIKKSDNLKKCRPKYHQAVITTALIELTYPNKTGTSYAWNDSQRSAFAGIAKQTYSDNQLSKYINFIIDEIRSNADKTRLAINRQLYN